MTQPSLVPKFLRSVGRILPYATRQRVLRLGRDIKSLPARFRAGARPLPWSFVHDVGGGDFYAVGEVIRNELVAFAGLKPQHHVLDIGCGTGRVAFALAGYLDREGLYTGFDVSVDGLAWMIRHLPKTQAGFRIVRADIFNTEYRPDATTSAAGYRFPVSDASVDVVFATSVFTHLRPDDARNYFLETARSLRSGGTAYVTAFVVTPERAKAIAAGGAYFKFHRFGTNAYVAAPDVPEAVIAFDEAQLMSWIAEAGLTLDRPFRPGSWCGQAAPDFQDVLLLRKV